MGRSLTIDQGNSTAKIAVHDGGLITETHRLTRDVAGETALIAMQAGVTRAIYSSVAGTGRDVTDRLESMGVTCLVLTPDTPLPIKVQYATPGTLGLDRVAGAVGAATRFPGRWVLTVDAGSAVTYDVVADDARFIGGNIAPGIGMRLRALHEHTRRLPEVSPDGDLPAWGYDTPTAMRAGAVYGVVAEIERYRRLLPPGTEVILTGGDADLIAPLAGPDVTVDQHLVNNGLNSILQYNENK
ncbi:MAG: type III pantothenate kinase [Pseudoflavonifractor sp.]|nr:type III pantothenate kinase [Pseudoflavonifractor sp.]